MKFLKTLVKPEHRLVDLLHMELGEKQQDRSIHTVHASDLTKSGFCPREVVLARHLKVDRQPKVVGGYMGAAATRVTWDEGRDKQYRVNNHYLREYMMGEWVCIRCHVKESFGCYPELSSHDCTSPHGHRWEYVEPLLKHSSGFVGSLDAVVQFSPTVRRMVEVKMLAHAEFKDLKAPLGEHRVRTRLYLHMLEDKQNSWMMVDTRVAHILYICRGHGVKHENVITPFKEYIVERNDLDIEHILAMARAANVKSPYRQMPEGICDTVMCKRAESCLVAKECFSGKYPAKVLWKAGHPT